MRAGRALAALLALSLGAPSALADRVVTQDGRVLSPKKAREEGAGYRLVFDHGEIVLPDRSLVASVEIEGDMSEYVPKNDDERQKLEQGYVKYRGRWLSAPAYQEELRKQHEASKKRTEELALHADWESAWQKETQHFALRTNTSPELLDYYAELLETYYALMDNRIGIDPPPSLRRTKMQVNIYKSHGEFLRLAEAGNPAVLGFFSPMAKSLNFFHDYAEPSRSEWVALHECTHLLTFLIDPQYRPQIWLNEAVADFFGSSKVYRDKKGKLHIEPGELQMDRVLTVQQAIRDDGVPTDRAKPEDEDSLYEGRPFTRLEDLFLLTRDQFDGFQYAHAWSFVYFLNTYQNGKYRKSFDRFFKGLYTLEKGIPFASESSPIPESGGVAKVVAAKDIREFLLKRLGVKDVAALEKEWKDTIAAIPIEGNKARLKRGLMAVGQMRFEEALPDLDAAIAGGVTDPRAWAARGRAHAMQGDFEQAVADLRTATEKDPLSASFRYLLSQYMLGKVTLGGHGATGASGASIEIDFDADKKLQDGEAKTQAGLAMELDPENDRFRSWYQRFE